MDLILQDFIVALRRSGVRVSLSEGLDALDSAALVGYGDRATLKDALAACLAKSLDEKTVFDPVFDRFFASEGSLPEAGGRGLTEVDLGLTAVDSPITLMLLSGDAAGVSVSMREAGREVGVSGIQYISQKGGYTQKILDRMGWEGLTEDLRRLEQDPERHGVLAARLKARQDALYKTVRRYVDEQFKLYGDPSSEEAERSLASMSFTQADARDAARLDALIHKLVKRFNTRCSRRLKDSRRGPIDIKSTLRKSAAFQGLPFQLRWKARRVERADIVAICDVSRSVRTAVRFLLLFLYGLSQAVARTRTFIFCSNLVEVTDLFDTYPVGEAIGRIQAGIGLDMKLGLTDYGEAFGDFHDKHYDAVTRKTTVIVLGDARNNHGDPRLDVVESIALRARRLVWLNPESRAQWDTGDSEMKRYLPYCHVAQRCRSVRDLERVMTTLLELSGSRRART